MRRHFFEILEAVYVAGGSESEWRARSVAAMSVLSEGFGVAVMELERSRDRVAQCRMFGSADPVFLAWLQAATLAMPAQHVGLAFSWKSSGRTASSIMAADFPVYERGLETTGARDILTTFGVVNRNTSFGAYVPLATPRKTSRNQRARMRMLGAHLGSAFRARSRTLDEAWFHADGKLCEAQGAARTQREELRTFVKRLDKLRARRGTGWDETDALSAWTAMVQGRWTLLDFFDSDGRRFVVARANEPELGRELALTSREELVSKLHGMGQSSKYVAYSLGLSTAVVSELLTTAMLKLNVKSRSELIRLYRELAGAEST